MNPRFLGGDSIFVSPLPINCEFRSNWNGYLSSYKKTMNTPLHPLLVHFPIVLTFCLPVLLFIFWIAERKGWVSQKIWWIAFTLSLANPLTSFLALRTGEQDEDLVEKFVSENLIEAHEEWGELVLWMGIGVCALLLAQVLFKRFNFLKLLTLLFALAAVFPMIQAGHTGGELVYKHGAAQAHIQRAAATLSFPQEHHDQDSGK